jgi:CheY-like chemotaxis protein
METGKSKVLLIGENHQGSSYLAKRLEEHGCECVFATSSQEVDSLLRTHEFDLVLSPMRLGDDSLFPLIRRLDGSDIALYFFHAVEDGCLWLPALRHGHNCFGSNALRPSEFVAVLDKAIEEICFPALAERKSLPSVTPRLSSSLAALPSSRVESPPARPEQIKKSAVVAA